MLFCLNSLIVYIYMEPGAVHNRSPNIPETKNVLDNNNNKTRPETKTNRNGKSAEENSHRTAAVTRRFFLFLFFISLTRAVCIIIICTRFDRV